MPTYANNCFVDVHADDRSADTSGLLCRHKLATLSPMRSFETTLEAIEGEEARVADAYGDDSMPTHLIVQTGGDRGLVGTTAGCPRDQG